MPDGMESEGVTIYFTSLKGGEADAYGLTAEDLSRQYVDGQCIRILSYKTKPFQLMSAVSVQTAAGLDQLQVIYKGFQGKIIKYTQRLELREDYFVWNVTMQPEASPAAGGVGGFDNYGEFNNMAFPYFVCYAIWTLQYVGNPEQAKAN